MTLAIISDTHTNIRPIEPVLEDTRPDVRDDHSTPISDTATIDTQLNVYQRFECATFRKTKEQFGGLSNMSPGFPVRVNGVLIPTTEALYQSCRFPLYPDIQKLIITQKSPMSSKMSGKPHRHLTRKDWDDVRVDIMRWCLRVKLSQHWTKFSKILLSTGDRPIVEDSHKDQFWGAVPQKTNPNVLVGKNVLGCLLTELREQIKTTPDTLRQVDVPEIRDFYLYDEPISPGEKI